MKPIITRHEKKLKQFPENLEKYKKALAIYKKKKAELEAAKSPKRIRGPRYPYNKKDHHVPGTLFNAMINPIVPYGIKGVIWYQGGKLMPHAPGSIALCCRQ